jgi:hypothetical protein
MYDAPGAEVILPKGFDTSARTGLGDTRTGLGDTRSA